MAIQVSRKTRTTMRDVVLLAFGLIVLIATVFEPFKWLEMGS